MQVMSFANPYDWVVPDNELAPYCVCEDIVHYDITVRTPSRNRALFLVAMDGRVCLRWLERCGGGLIASTTPEPSLKDLCMISDQFVHVIGWCSELSRRF